MTTGTDSLRVRFRWTPALCGLIAILIGATGLTGWLLNVDVLKRLHPALSSMKANSAMGLELAGLALLLATARAAPPWRRRVAWVCATFVTLLGLLTLGEYIFAADLRIDELLVRDLTSATLPGRMGANTAACFLLIGVALLLLNVRWRVLERLAEGFALAAFVVALAALLGFAYDASVLRRLVSATEMSLHSALSFVLLCVGLLAARPCRPFVAMLLSPGRSGVLLRMAPMTVPLFWLLGWLRLMGERAGLYDTAFGVGLFVLASIILMNLLIWRAAWNIDRLDTARKAAEEAERAIDAHLRVTLRSIGDAVISLDVAGNVTFMNAAAENVSGWTRAEAQGCPLTEVLHIDGHTRAQVDEFAVKGIHNGFSDGLDNYMIVVARDGRETPVDYSFAPIRDEGHNLAGAVLVLRDTTERKHAEEARRKLEHIFNNAGWAVAVADAAGRTLEMVNPAFAAMHGYTVEELIDESLLKVFAPETRDELLMRIAAADAMDDYVYESIHLRKDGTRFPILAHGTTLRDEAGRVLYRAATYIDLTEQKQAQEKLRYQLDLTQTITDNTQSCLWMMDSEGRGTFANPATERVTGFKPQELVGQILHDKVHHTHPNGAPFPKEDCPLDRALSLHESIVGYEDVFVHKDGHFYPVRCNCRPILKEGKLAGTVIEVQDITLEKQLLGSETKARQQAEAANRLKDEFLATLSHELRTPLSAVLGWAVMMRSGRLSSDKVVKAVETIERNARALGRLVEDLLDVSRIMTGKVHVQMQPVVAAKVIDAAVASAQHMADAKGVALQVVVDSRSSAVLGDADRLQQVVWNLVSNAVKFTPKGGRVQVRLEPVNSHIEITVSDTGEGIAPEFLPHVFDRFRQADASAQRKHGGLGLGLAIVRHLVELHGGEVHVESPGLGQGTTFTVKLPLAAMRKEAAIREPHFAFADSAPRLDGVKVLLVDDEADARALLMEMLSERGAEARAASNMTEALSLLNEWRPDVLVSDIGMPEGSGYDLIREVRMRDAAKSQVPAVALTAYARAEDRVRALSAGFQMHVPKPIEPEELLTVIASLTSSRARQHRPV